MLITIHKSRRQEISTYQNFCLMHPLHLSSRISNSFDSTNQSGDFKSQKEAVWALTNLTSGGSVEQISLVVQFGGINPMCDLLVSKDSRLLMVLLDGINNMLEAASKVGQAKELGLLIEECSGLDKIEDLQSHENVQVYKKSLSIIENYFADDDEVNSVAPEGNTETNQYVFGTGEVSSTTGFSF